MAFSRLAIGSRWLLGLERNLGPSPAGTQWTCMTRSVPRFTLDYFLCRAGRAGAGH